MFKFIFGHQTWKEGLITVLGVLCSVGLVVIALMAQQSFRNVLEKDISVDRTQYAIQLADKTMADLASAETSQRGYVIAGDTVYLGSYARNKDSVHVHFNFLKEFAHKNAQQQAQLTALSQLIEQRIQMLERGIRLKANQQDTALARFFASRRSKNIMDEARKTAQMIKQYEQQQLVAYEQKFSSSVQNTQQVIYTIVGGVILLQGIIFFLLIRATGQRIAFASQLHAANQDLHTFAEELQATNKELQTANERGIAMNEELARTGQLLQQAMNAAHLGHWEVDLLSSDQRVVWSEEIYRIHGLQPKESLSLAEVQSFILEEDLPALRRLIQRLIETGEAFNYTCRIRRNDGNIRYVYTHSFAVLDAQGRIVKRRGILQDVTEQKIINFELARTAAMLKESQERAKLGHWELDVSGAEQNIFWSDELYRIFNLVPAQKITLPFLEQIILREDYLELTRLIQRALERSQPYEYVYRIRHGESIRFLETKGFPITDRQGKITKIRGITQDITIRKEMERELQRANEILEQKVAQRTVELQKLADTLQEKNKELTKTNTDLDNFIYMSSHELKHPITNLEGLLSMIPLIHQRSPEEIQQWMEMMNVSVLRLKRTIDHITDISKVQKELEEASSLLHFDQVVKEITQDLAPLIKEHQATIHTNFQVPSITYIPHYLKSILQNLLSNAIKYRDPLRQAQVYLATYAEQDTIVLSVRDNGLGLSEGDQKKLFKMFKRLHVHVDGTGIGLYMIKRMVENYGGYITVESSPGEGTTFRVHFCFKNNKLSEKQKIQHKPT